MRVHDIPRGLGRGKKLSVGQKQWLKSTTFDGKIGNPVLAKYDNENPLASCLRYDQQLQAIEAVQHREFLR